jgi:hypothetical protein
MSLKNRLAYYNFKKTVLRARDSCAQVTRWLGVGDSLGLATRLGWRLAWVGDSLGLATRL